MKDIDIKIAALVRAERIKKLKIILGFTIVFLLLIWFTLDNKGGSLL